MATTALTRLPDDLERLAAAPLETRVLELWVDPELAFLHFAASAEYAYWLDAGPAATAGWSFLAMLDGCADAYTLFGDPDLGSATLQHPFSGRAAFVGESVLPTLGRTSVRGRREPLPDGVALGWAGWLGYESGARALGVPHAGVGVPDTVLLFAPRQIAFDHAARRIRISWLRGADGKEAGGGDAAGPGRETAETAEARWLRETVDALRALAGREAADPPPAPELGPVSARHPAAEYRRLIERCQERITAGDAYQLCLTNRFETTTEESPFTVYRRLRRANPSGHGGLVVAGDRALLSSSPEVFLDVTARGEVTTRPIKGTRPRGRDRADDDRLRAELRGDEKELAENLMIVDLMRNDLGAVCELGSVAVTSLFAVEAHPNVFQLVSTVVGRLRPECGTGELLRSAFPAGSMTGAPKESAMRILHGLEAGPRGAYAGAFGVLAVDGSLQLAMTIRTIVLDGPRVSIGSGGGITALSRAELEIDETHTKIAPLLRALGARLEGAAQEW